MGNEEFMLVAALSEGKDSAWRTLYELHYPYMCYLASQYLHDDFLAETVANDVITHLWEIRSKLYISKSLRSYLLDSTRNRCLDLLKSNYSKKVSSTFGSDEITKNVFDTEHPLGILLEKELEVHLSDAMKKMPHQTRTVFNMSRNDGMTYEEISSMLGITVNTVKYHIKKALSYLRFELGELMGAIALFIAFH